MDPIKRPADLISIFEYRVEIKAAESGSSCLPIAFKVQTVCVPRSFFERPKLQARIRPNACPAKGRDGKNKNRENRNYVKKASLHGCVSWVKVALYKASKMPKEDSGIRDPESGMKTAI
jgi:hypothetical protein